MGCSRVARWDIRGTEELGDRGDRGDSFQWLAEEAKKWEIFFGVVLGLSKKREQGGGLSGRRGRTVKNPTHLAGEDRPQVQLLWISNLF